MKRPLEPFGMSHITEEKMAKMGLGVAGNRQIKECEAVA
jgi:hypothetical protein